MKISRELPYELEFKHKKDTIKIQGKVHEYMKEDFTMVNREVGLDSKGRIWVLTWRKQLPEDFNREDFLCQEYYIFEVFSEEGVLLTRVPFPDTIETFDNFTMRNDHIYFADPQGQACVYIYKVVGK
jgi:hypothetical protein